MAKAVKRKRPAAARRRSSGTPRTALVIVLCVAGLLAIGSILYLRQRGKNAAPPAPTTAAPAQRGRPRPPPPKGGAERFEFYGMLPKAIVTVHPADNQPRIEPAPMPVQVPGSYVLFVGSYATYADADHMKARLGMLGIRSEIQDVTVEDRQYRRVRIGPVENLDELNRMRRQLRDARIEGRLDRVGD